MWPAAVVCSMRAAAVDIAPQWVLRCTTVDVTSPMALQRSIYLVRGLVRGVAMHVRHVVTRRGPSVSGSVCCTGFPRRSEVLCVWAIHPAFVTLCSAWSLWSGHCLPELVLRVCRV